MPSYDHSCSHCKYEWEENYSIKEDPPKICPKCKSESVKRLISSGGTFVLAGGGWADSGYSSK